MVFSDIKKKTIFFLFLLIFTGKLFGFESETVRNLEKTSYTELYKKLTHIAFEIKKKEEELYYIEKNIARVKKDSILKEEKANSLLEDINQMPLVETSMLLSDSISLSSEQMIENFSAREKKWQSIDVNMISNK